jgi:hypothetical protein
MMRCEEVNKQKGKRKELVDSRKSQNLHFENVEVNVLYT